MTGILRFVFGDIGIKITALIVALFIWLVAALDRDYVTSFMVPVVLDKVETRKIISEFETRVAEVSIEGKGRDLLTLRLRQPRFLLTVPEGRAGMKELKLNPADLTIPGDLTIKSIVPELVELRLNEIGTRRVAVEVPTRGTPRKGLSIASIRPLGRVKLFGPKDEVRLFAVVLTESLDLGRVKEPDTIMMRIVPPEGDGFSTEPETIAVVVTVEQEAARIFLGIPVQVVSLEEADISVEPSEAQIAVAGPSSRLDELKPADVQARVRIATLKPGQHRLAAEITLPPGFHLVKCEPALFDITIR